MNRKPFIPLLVFVLFASLACNLLSPGAIEQAVKDAGEGLAQTAVVSGQSTVQASAKTAVAAAQTPDAIPTAVSIQPEAPSAALNSLSGLTNGIDQLDSYRITSEIKVSGKDSQGLDQTGFLLMEQVKIKATGNYSMKITTEGAMAGSSPASTVELYRDDGVLYMISPGEQSTCMGVTDSSGFGDMDPLAAADFASNLSNLNLVEQGVTVNGILTDHYTFDEKAFATGEYKSAKGDVWIAQAGGFAVRMEGTATGMISMASSMEGTIDWTYELSDINQLSAIVLPAGCEKPIGTDGDIPVPENATEISSLDTFLTFKTSDTPKVVADYYLTKLAELGWQVDSNNDMDQIILLGFTQDGKRLDVTISGDGTSTTVVIVQAP